VEIKPVPVVTRGKLTIRFHHGSVGTHIRRCTHLILLEIYSGVTVPVVIAIG